VQELISRSGIEQLRVIGQLREFHAFNGLEEVVGPSRDGVATHAMLHRRHALLLFFERHDQRHLQRLDHTVEVVRVDLKRLAEFLGGAGHLGEHQDAAVVPAGSDVLLGDEVHTVAKRGDQGHV